MNRSLLSLMLVAVLACRQSPPSPSAGTEAEPPLDRAETGNLLNIGLGAAVVDRTGEIHLDNSAVRAIDGDLNTLWMSVPNDPLQTLTFSLPARARVDRVGFRTPSNDAYFAERLLFEGSANGQDYVRLGEFAAARTREVQLFPIAAAELRYIRLSVLKASGYLPQLFSVQARGRLLEAPRAGTIEGCWQVNQFPARFAREGTAVQGTLGVEDPLALEGGVEGALYRFAWTRGPDWGVAAITVGPEGLRLSGLRWFEKPLHANSGGSWFGQRSEKCDDALRRHDVISRFLQRTGSFPLYGLRFDEQGALMEKESARALGMIAGLLQLAPQARPHLIAREFRERDAQSNLRKAQQRVDALRAALQRQSIDVTRLQFVAAGSDEPPVPMETALARAMSSFVELSVR